MVVETKIMVTRSADGGVKVKNRVTSVTRFVREFVKKYGPLEVQNYGERGFRKVALKRTNDHTFGYTVERASGDLELCKSTLESLFRGPVKALWWRRVKKKRKRRK